MHSSSVGTRANVSGTSTHLAPTSLASTSSSTYQGKVPPPGTGVPPKPTYPHPITQPPRTPAASLIGPGTPAWWACPSLIGNGWINQCSAHTRPCPGTPANQGYLQRAMYLLLLGCPFACRHVALPSLAGTCIYLLLGSKQTQHPALVMASQQSECILFNRTNQHVKLLFNPFSLDIYAAQLQNCSLGLSIPSKTLQLTTRIPPTLSYTNQSGPDSFTTSFSKRSSHRYAKALNGETPYPMPVSL